MQVIPECHKRKSPMEEASMSESHQEEEVVLVGPIYDDTKGIVDRET
jgi:hypothetical protein